MSPEIIAKIVHFLNNVTLKPQEIPDFQAVMAILQQEFNKAQQPPLDP